MPFNSVLFRHHACIAIACVCSAGDPTGKSPLSPECVGPDVHSQAVLLRS